MQTAASWNSPDDIGGRRLWFVDQLPSERCIIRTRRTAASVYASGGTLFMPKSTSSQAVLGAETIARSINRSGAGIIDCGSCGISAGALRPRLFANPAAADGRSCEWHELQP